MDMIDEPDNEVIRDQQARDLGHPLSHKGGKSRFDDARPDLTEPPQRGRARSSRKVVKSSVTKSTASS